MSEIHLDVTVKTVLEEYTPLHLAAHIKTTQEGVEDDKDESNDSKAEGTTEADGSSSLTRRNSIKESTMWYLLKSCKGVDVSPTAHSWNN